jgi:hypothetical protein
MASDFERIGKRPDCRALELGIDTVESHSLFLHTGRVARIALASERPADTVKRSEGIAVVTLVSAAWQPSRPGFSVFLLEELRVLLVDSCVVNRSARPGKHDKLSSVEPQWGFTSEPQVEQPGIHDFRVKLLGPIGMLLSAHSRPNRTLGG